MKGMKMGKKEVKPVLFADSIILYIEKIFFTDCEKVKTRIKQPKVLYGHLHTVSHS